MGYYTGPCAHFDECGEAEAPQRFSLGLYAGKWCDDHWVTSGYRKEGPEGFDPLDAGESYDEE
jgi:hypothetical protein